MGPSEKDKKIWTEKVLQAFGGRLRRLFSPSFANFWCLVFFVFLLRETVRAANKTKKNKFQSEKNIDFEHLKDKENHRSKNSPDFARFCPIN